MLTERTRERQVQLGSRPNVNSAGDVVLVDPESMRALADPFRLALLGSLRREGSATTDELSSRFDRPRDDVQAHLDELLRRGFVTYEGVLVGDPRWTEVGKGFAFELPDDPEGQAAARQLVNAMRLNYVDLPRRWVADDEPRLDLEWARAAGVFNARVTLTPDELRDVQEGLERLLEPFVRRAAGETPAAAEPVRILSYFMPEAPRPS